MDKAPLTGGHIVSANLGVDGIGVNAIEPGTLDDDIYDFSAGVDFVLFGGGHKQIAFGNCLEPLGANARGQNLQRFWSVETHLIDTHGIAALGTDE